MQHLSALMEYDKKKCNTWSGRSAVRCPAAGRADPRHPAHPQKYTKSGHLISNIKIGENAPPFGGALCFQAQASREQGPALLNEHVYVSTGLEEIFRTN